MGRPAMEHRKFLPVADLVVSRGRQHDRWRYRTSSEALPFLSHFAVVTPTLIDWRRRRKANLPTPDLAGLTPKNWAAQRGQVISRAS